MILAALLSASIATGGNPRATEIVQDDARLTVAVDADLYTWTVTNEGTTPITAFEIEAYNIYNQLAPKGWSIEHDIVTFRAWADAPRYGIRPGRSGEFSGRVTSTAAILGAVPTSAERADGTTITFDGVWGPIPKPASHVWLIAGILSGIALVHGALIRRSARPAG